MPSPLQNKRIVLGVTGSIAAYKAVDLASKLTQAGALVDTILTYGAGQFVTAIAFRSLTHRPVVTQVFDPHSELAVEHVALARAADIVVVAPATAHLMAKMAHGLADDALTTTLLATEAPILVAPAMDAHMFTHPATQENVATLKRRGVVFVGPASGRLASGLVGIGRLSEPAEIFGHICAVLGRRGDLAGRSIVVSAGGTQEAIDPVRVVTNRSSGRMGYALAEAARDRGASVTLVAAPTALRDPPGVKVVKVGSASQMRDAVQAALSGADALIMAAAVADYQPAAVSPSTVKKGPTRWTLDMTRTPDILAEAQGGFIRVGFAAETEDVLANARQKLEKKKLDLIVANQVSGPESALGGETSRATILGRDGKQEELPLLSKYDVAWRVLDRVKELLQPR
ncbi:MAG: bifunctional phosphopantothenoylcysteine decarboxylase/phosphopantothenate--cysteine ligase CoaBC [Chloroflexota bacterium]|nr:bifunctional phosphopantothenoylcysteine decarboxylase/phosphopantothenate--cysteine ligase CoaBC [Chloroflexota bacterium]